MRHASSPRTIPTKEEAASGNDKLERQLDAAGRSTASAMGKAIQTLKIPINETLSSPTFRALETARLAGLPNPKPHDELGDGGQSMSNTTQTQAAWLQSRVKQAPARGNTIIVTHSPNLASAFPEISNVADGETLVFHPDGKGAAPLVARIKIEEWPQLAGGKVIASETGSGHAYGVEGALSYFLVNNRGSLVEEKRLGGYYPAGCKDPSKCIPWGPRPGDTVSFDLPPGDYELVSVKRPCEMNCGRVGGPVGECRAAFTLKAGETVYAQRVNRGSAEPPCGVTFSTAPLSR
jgi:phosphohistidine phosphatase SixA